MSKIPLGKIDNYYFIATIHSIKYYSYIQRCPDADYLNVLGRAYLYQFHSTFPFAHNESYLKAYEKLKKLLLFS